MMYNILSTTCMVRYGVTRMGYVLSFFGCQMVHARNMMMLRILLISTFDFKP
jgi:hypothetical protein